MNVHRANMWEGGKEKLCIIKCKIPTRIEIMDRGNIQPLDGMRGTLRQLSLSPIKKQHTISISRGRNEDLIDIRTYTSWQKQLY